MSYKDKEKQNGYQRQYYQDHKEYMKEYMKEYNKQWRKDNPAKVALWNLKHETNRNLRIPKWLSVEEKKQIELFYDNCPEGYRVDHIIPLQGKLVSGLHRISNLQYLTIKANAEKSNKYEIKQA